MSTATDFIQVIVGKAVLAKAREKVPGLMWGHGCLLRLSEKTACFMGIAALAACETPESLDGRNLLTQAAVRRRGWPNPGRERLTTPCPHCGSADTRPVQLSVAHVNDTHGWALGLVGIRRVLREWIKQELAAEG